MIKLTTAALFFLAAGIFTSVTILSAYQILFAIPLIWFTYLAVKEKNFKLPTSAWFLLAFAAVAVISLVINIDLVPKPSKNFGRVKYFLFGACGIFVLRAWLKEASNKSKKFLLNTFFLSIVVAACYAVWYWLTQPDGRVRGLTDTMRYGYGTGMMLLTLLSAILHHKKLGSWFNWKVAIPVFLFGFLGMYLTNTRGAMLGFLCGLPFVLYFYNRKLGLTLGGLAVLGVLSLGGMYLFGSGQYESRYLTNMNNNSDIIRRSQWKAAFIATTEKPILGYGFSNFSSQLKRIKLEHDLDAKDYESHSHNILLETSAGVGLIGLAIFLGWIISWAIESFRAGGLTRALVVPFGVAFITSGQFEVVLDANNASMIFFLYALSSAGKENV